MASAMTVDEAVLQSLEDVMPACTREVLRAALEAHAGNANAAIGSLLDTRQAAPRPPSVVTIDLEEATPSSAQAVLARPWSLRRLRLSALSGATPRGIWARGQAVGSGGGAEAVSIAAGNTRPAGDSFVASSGSRAKASSENGASGAITATGTSGTTGGAAVAVGDTNMAVHTASSAANVATGATDRDAAIAAARAAGNSASAADANGAVSAVAAPKGVGSDGAGDGGAAAAIPASSLPRAVSSATSVGGADGGVPAVLTLAGAGSDDDGTSAAAPATATATAAPRAPASAAPGAADDAAGVAAAVGARATSSAANVGGAISGVPAVAPQNGAGCDAVAASAAAPAVAAAAAAAPAAAAAIAAPAAAAAGPPGGRGAGAAATSAPAGTGVIDAANGGSGDVALGLVNGDGDVMPISEGAAEGDGAGEISVSIERSRCCALCVEDAPFAVLLACGHGWYCTDCVRRHAAARVEAGASDVSCPECGTPISERHLRVLLPDGLIDRLLSRSLQRLGNLRPCPTPDCPGLVSLEEGDVPRFSCPLCGKESCLKCSAQPYHLGKTCEEHARKRKREEDEERDEEVFRRWMERTGTKQCPVCSSAVTKENLEQQETQTEECHKMMCRQCGTRFCFQCLAILTATSSCSCTNPAHGFIDPRTGRFVQHLTARAQKELEQRGRAVWREATARTIRGRFAR